MKKRLVENPVFKVTRKLIKEGEIESAQAVLASKDLVDRLQDNIQEIGKMSNDELPHVVDALRASLGSEVAQNYSETANRVLNDLLTTIKDKKAELENATLALTGEGTMDVSNSDLDLPTGEQEEEDTDARSLDDLEKDDLDLDNDLEDLDLDEEEIEKNAAGRKKRIPTKESFLFKKKIYDAHIANLQKALRETNKKRFPLRAKRLSEAIRKVAIKAIKEESKIKSKNRKDKDSKQTSKYSNVKKSSKKMMIPVSKKKEELKKKISEQAVTAKHHEIAAYYHRDKATKLRESSPLLARKHQDIAKEHMFIAKEMDRGRLMMKEARMINESSRLINRLK